MVIDLFTELLQNLPRSFVLIFKKKEKKRRNKHGLRHLYIS